MLISDSRKFIFVHIRKSAGSSFRRLLSDHVIQSRPNLLWKLLSRNGVGVHYHRFAFRSHAPLALAEKAMPADLFKGYFKFAIVRNPWDRLVSEYEYIRHRKDHSRHAAVMAMRFSEFVAFQARRPEAHQINMLTLANGDIGCDFVGKFEQLAQAARIVEAMTGIACHNLPRLNSTPRGDFKNYYDSRLWRYVHEHWQRDITAFGYQDAGEPGARIPAPKPSPCESEQSALASAAASE